MTSSTPLAWLNNSILHRKRSELHRRVGEAIETLFADSIESNAHRLAHHFAAAGDAERALRYYVMAGEGAAAVSANADAATHYEHAVRAANDLRLDPHEMERLRGRQAELAGTSAA